MKIEQQQVGSVAVLAPDGPLADEDVAVFRKVLVERLQSPNPRIVVSMHDVPYVDSVALEMLLDAADELAQRAMSLKLVKVTPTCREILELTGCAERFSFFNEIQDAVKSYL